MSGGVGCEIGFCVRARARGECRREFTRGLAVLGIVLAFWIRLGEILSRGRDGWRGGLGLGGGGCGRLPTTVGLPSSFPFPRRVPSRELCCSGFPGRCGRGRSGVQTASLRLASRARVAPRRRLGRAIYGSSIACCHVATRSRKLCSSTWKHSSPAQLCNSLESRSGSNRSSSPAG